MRVNYYHFLLLIGVATIQCTKVTQHHTFAIEYPQPLPDSIPLAFLPGIVCGDSLDFNASFSPDGKKFYFSRSGKGKWMIYVTERRGKEWSKPVAAPFTESQYSQADPFIANDGTLFFISNRPRDDNDSISDYDIWYVRPQSDGSWSDPVNPSAINSDSTEYYVSLSDNGNMYFASNRGGTLGSHDIYVSQYVNGVYETPQNLGASVNTEMMEHDPLISPDERYMIFTSVDRVDSYGSGDLYYSLRNSDGTWMPAINMGIRFNTHSYEYCSYLTADKQYFFYSSNYDVKWINARNFPWLRTPTSAQ